MNPEQPLAARIARGYGLRFSAIRAPQKGYRNTSYAIETVHGTLNLIVYKSEPDILQTIRRANHVGDFAAQQGLPARRTSSLKVAHLVDRSRQTYAALYHFLPGQTIPWEAYTMEHIKALGHGMAQLHHTLANYKARDLPDVTEQQLKINHRMQRYFGDPTVQKALAQKLQLQVERTDFTRVLTACRYLPNPQALHMDFVRGNILFTNTTITGILDFEKTARGSTLFDIARTLAFLMVDCKYKNQEQIRKYFLRSGYKKRGKGIIKRFIMDGIDILEELVLFFLLHDFYKFLRHNPYEALPQNEHFLRTKTILLNHRLIASTAVE